jgi:hypothetical protein
MLPGPPDRASRPAPGGRPCLRRRSGAHTAPRSTRCPRAAPARRPHGSPSAPPQHHQPSRPQAAVASALGVVGRCDATTGLWLWGACRSSHAPGGQALPARCPRAAQHQLRGDEQNATAGPCAAHRHQVEHRAGGNRCSRPSSSPQLLLTQPGIAHRPVPQTQASVIFPTGRGPRCSGTRACAPRRRCRPAMVLPSPAL